MGERLEPMVVRTWGNGSLQPLVRFAGGAGALFPEPAVDPSVYGDNKAELLLDSRLKNSPRVVYGMWASDENGAPTRLEGGVKWSPQDSLTPLGRVVPTSREIVNDFLTFYASKVSVQIHDCVAAAWRERGSAHLCVIPHLLKSEQAWVPLRGPPRMVYVPLESLPRIPYDKVRLFRAKMRFAPRFGKQSGLGEVSWLIASASIESEALEVCDRPTRAWAVVSMFPPAGRLLLVGACARSLREVEWPEADRVIPDDVDMMDKLVEDMYKQRVVLGECTMKWTAAPSGGGWAPVRVDLACAKPVVDVEPILFGARYKTSKEVLQSARETFADEQSRVRKWRPCVLAFVEGTRGEVLTKPLLLADEGGQIEMPTWRDHHMFEGFLAPVGVVAQTVSSATILVWRVLNDDWSTGYTYALKKRERRLRSDDYELFATKATVPRDLLDNARVLAYLESLKPDVRRAQLSQLCFIAHIHADGQGIDQALRSLRQPLRL